MGGVGIQGSKLSPIKLGVPLGDRSIPLPTKK